jgi:capsid protein
MTCEKYRRLTATGQFLTVDLPHHREAVMTRFAKTILAALISLGGTVGAQTVSYSADLDSYVEESGVCAEPWVLHRITTRFRYQVHHVPNLPDVEITDFQRIHEHRYLPAQEDHPIGRRYCGATVALSDGSDRDIWYLIEEGQGFASIVDNVEFCLSGFDRWYVYNGRCRVLR